MAGYLYYGCLILVIAHSYILLSALTAQAPRRPITMPARVRSYKAITMPAPLPCRLVEFTADRAGLSPYASLPLSVVYSINESQSNGLGWTRLLKLEKSLHLYRKWEGVSSSAKQLHVGLYVLLMIY